MGCLPELGWGALIMDLLPKRRKTRQNVKYELPQSWESLWVISSRPTHVPTAIRMGQNQVLLMKRKIDHLNARSVILFVIDLSDLREKQKDQRVRMQVLCLRLQELH